MSRQKNHGLHHNLLTRFLLEIGKIIYDLGKQVVLSLTKPSADAIDVLKRRLADDVQCSSPFHCCIFLYFSPHL